MKKENSSRFAWRSYIAPLASLKLAIFTLSSLSLLVALGTVVESRYDADFAREQVYHRWWMFALLILLATNLTSVMIHRWPWRKRHLGFLFAHIGILTVLAGAFWTYLWGIDGSLYLPLQSKARYVSLPEKEITVYASFDGTSFTQLIQEKISFLKWNGLVSKSKSPPLLAFSLGEESFSVLDFKLFTLGKRTFEASQNLASHSISNFRKEGEEKKARGQIHRLSPALFFQMKSKRLGQNTSQWLWQKWPSLPAYEDLGPARVLLSQGVPSQQDWKKWVGEKKKKALWFFISPPSGFVSDSPSASSASAPASASVSASVPAPVPVPASASTLASAANSSSASSSPSSLKGQIIHYRVYSFLSHEALKEGKVQVGDTLIPGWMDFKIQLLRYLPQAQEKWSFESVPSPLQGKAKPALQISFRKEKHWLQLNQSLKFFTDSKVYLFSFAQKRFDLGYDLELKDFQVEYYPGTRQASEYRSHLKLPNGKEVQVSMNEPLKYQKMTFYQASYQKDSQGRPLASILSVNYDPGRWWKYLGSAMTVCGILFMFYRKRKKTFMLKASSLKVKSALLWTPLFFLSLFFLFLFPISALSSEESTAPPFAKALGTLPLQEGGRIKPFDSFARESLLQIYGKQSYGGRPAHEVVFTWILNPSLWTKKPLILISHKQLKKDLALPENQKHFSIEDLEKKAQIPLLLQDLEARKERGYKLRDYDRSLSRLQSQMGRLAQIMNGELAFLPSKDSKTKTWIPFHHFDEDQKKSFSNLTQDFLKVVQFYVKRVKVRARGGRAKEGEGKGEKEEGEDGGDNDHKDDEDDEGNKDEDDEGRAKFIQKELLQAQRQLEESIQQFKDRGRKIQPANYPSERRIRWEVHYNNFKPFFWASLLYFFVLLLGFFNYLYQSLWSNKQNSMDTDSRDASPSLPETLALQSPLATFFQRLRILTVLVCVVAFLLHSYGFILRVYLSQRPPVSNIYETLVWVAWGAMVFAFLLSYLRRFFPVLISGALVASLCLFVSDIAPTILDPSIRPLEAVLRSNFWLFFHVLTITISYAAFFIAFVLAELGLWTYLQTAKTVEESDKENVPSNKVQRILKVREQLLSVLYLCLQIGVVLLTTGVILGGIWADYSWGRFWGWDPKETWALIALLGYIVILHGRIAGWLKEFGLFMASSFAFFLVIMSWYGVNFLLGTGRHSYGFGSGGAVYVFSFAGLHLFYALVVAVRQALLTYRR